MESLIDNLDTTKWEEQNISEKKQDQFQEYHVMRAHKRINPTTIHYMIAVEDGDPINVELFDCKKDHDPLKNVSLVEIAFEEFGDNQKRITGIDLNGDIVVRKS